MHPVRHRFIQSNGIRIHLAEQGEGPIVVLCHGWPESWYSWRYQFEALASAGFHAVAPDMRGYGQTDRPEAIDAYTLLHLVGDMVGVLDALGSETTVIVGHDWGVPVAWHAALLRPDRFRAVIGLSVPFRPRGKVQPTTVMPRTDQAVFYQLYFQTPGVAEADLEADVRASMRDTLLRVSGDVPWLPASEGFSMVPLAGGLRARMSDHQSRALPPWLSEADLDFYVSEFSCTGFRGGLNWYRNIDRNWALLSPFAGAKIATPALYLAGDRDLVLLFPGMKELVTNCPAAGTGLSRNVTRQ
jgi:pimeloyl-ACP methyl ester carboxylesterase